MARKLNSPETIKVYFSGGLVSFGFIMSVILISPPAKHNSKVETLMKEIQESVGTPGGEVRLDKKDSNLFRHRKQTGGKKVDVKNFVNVLTIDPEAMTCESEGMITFEALTRETLKFGLLPPCVPELKSITLGGAVSGIGVESSSFRYGFVHETVLEMDILTPTGEILHCTPKNKYKDLFFGFPNSYGTLGYIVKLKIKLIKAKKYLRLTHTRYQDYKTYFADLKKLCLKNRDAKKAEFDYIDGVIFSSSEMYITRAAFTDEAPYKSDYTYMQIYYRSIQNRTEDFLSAYDYIWRWDTDWFWCSRKLHVQGKWLRRLFGRRFLKSTVYWKILNFNRKYGLLDKVDKIFSPNDTFQTVVQDVEIPIENCEKFMSFFDEHVKIEPVWVCPVMVYDPKVKYDIYPMKPGKVHINYGFWDVVELDGTDFEEGYVDKKIEAKVEQLKGHKSLYSTSFYEEAHFWKLYNGKRYHVLKKKYDPDGAFKDLYQKCVHRE